jgi:hypothetical protein
MKILTGLTKVEELINLAEKVVIWNVVFQAKLVKQCVLLSR